MIHDASGFHAGLGPAALSDWRLRKPKPDTPVDLGAYDPGAKPFTQGSKARDIEAAQLLASEIDELQNLLYADGRYKLLVILQGMDTSGKDGTLRGVFNRTSPLGVQAIGFKAPTADELAHDFLWRVHRCVPAAGHITVFNRSHYEDVLVPVVQQWISPAQARQRMAQINDFERMLSESGTVVLKFMLHISLKEQAQRLQERIDQPAKHWKFSAGDLEARKQWSAYQGAYGAFLASTSTAWAPWTIVPADSKSHRNLMVATVVRNTLAGMALRFPPKDPALDGLRVT